MTTSIEPAIAPGTYRIEPHDSSVAFTIRALFGLDTVRGTVALGEGAIVLAADPTQSTASATIEAASFRTGNARRDKDVTSRRFLDAAAYPSITFASTSVEPQPDGTWQVTGELTVRDTTTAVTLTVTKSVATPAGCRLMATARVDRHACGVTRMFIIPRYVDITLDITAAAST
jgi:polyisoprenoid-binding protein YceI